MQFLAVKEVDVTTFLAPKLSINVLLEWLQSKSKLICGQAPLPHSRRPHSPNFDRAKRRTRARFRGRKLNDNAFKKTEFVKFSENNVSKSEVRRGAAASSEIYRQQVTRGRGARGKSIVASQRNRESVVHCIKETGLGDLDNNYVWFGLVLAEEQTVTPRGFYADS
ncbi:hypothetical protein PanWU01x14_089210 [Parasponia andersonii]|uniref:Uncharacterized protein n=1 Tax=Parasponia andersonii TaxID=3476 RepID=A0A2P5D7I5_PARAD|nr:hypothetical protein PanWU01x14_089210 [Parasponia andersonii]